MILPKKIQDLIITEFEKHHNKSFGISLYDFIEKLSQNFDNLLIDDGNELSLVNQSTGNSFILDFTANEYLSRIDGKSKKLSIVQAVEGRKKTTQNIIDMTAGFCLDSMALASRGHCIIAIEKSFDIFCLLLHAFAKSDKSIFHHTILKKITLIHADSSEILQQVLSENKIDAIYFDPMFPSRKKKSQVKLRMQCLQNLDSVDFHNDDYIVDNIRKIFSKKIVVKKPIKSSFLSKNKPSSQLLGKINRYDVYF